MEKKRISASPRRRPAKRPPHLRKKRRPKRRLADLELIERRVARVIIKPEALEVCLVPGEASIQAKDASLSDPAPCRSLTPRAGTQDWTLFVATAITAAAIDLRDAMA